MTTSTPSALLKLLMEKGESADLAAFVAYDQRLVAAAEAAGLVVSRARVRSESE